MAKLRVDPDCYTVNRISLSFLYLFFLILVLYNLFG